MNYINGTFSNGDNPVKVTFLSGHDSNVASLFAAMAIKPYQLPHQFETTPISGKVVFQKWRNNETDE